MKRRVLGLAIVLTTLVAPFAVTRPASACGQCQEQAIINAIRCFSSGPFWNC
jgi:hypothetical protein